jgi:hypothetical protein
MTLAHELQHAVQHAVAHDVWAVNGLVQRSGTIVEALQLTWADIPIEREARIVSKATAIHLFGDGRVEEFIDQKLAEQIADAADWRFIRTLTPSTSVNLAAETKRLFERVRPFRSALEDALQQAKDRDNPDYTNVDLSPFF